MDKKEEEFTPQELNRAKALLLSELSQIEDKDSKSREYRLRHFSANDLIKAVSEETLYLGNYRFACGIPLNSLFVAKIF